MILFKKRTKLNKEIKVGKRIDFHNSVLFFEEDFYRPIKFLTFERDNYSYSSLKRKLHQKSSARNSILNSKKDLSDILPTSSSLKRPSTFVDNKIYKYDHRTNIKKIKSSMFVNNQSSNRIVSANFNDEGLMKKQINSSANLNNKLNGDESHLTWNLSVKEKEDLDLNKYCYSDDSNCSHSQASEFSRSHRGSDKDSNVYNEEEMELDESKSLNSIGKFINLNL